MKLKAAFTLFNKRVTRGYRLAIATRLHRARGRQLNGWTNNEKQVRRWLRHCCRLQELKARWFGEGEAE